MLTAREIQEIRDIQAVLSGLEKNAESLNNFVETLKDRMSTLTIGRSLPQKLTNLHPLPRVRKITATELLERVTEHWPRKLYYLRSWPYFSSPVHWEDSSDDEGSSGVQPTSSCSCGPECTRRHRYRPAFIPLRQPPRPNDSSPPPPQYHSPLSFSAVTESPPPASVTPPPPTAG